MNINDPSRAATLADDHQRLRDFLCSDPLMHFGKKIYNLQRRELHAISNVHL